MHNPHPDILSCLPEKLEFEFKQCVRFTYILGTLVKYTPDGASRLGRITLPEGYVVFASMREKDIINSSTSPELKTFALSDDETLKLYVNTCLDLNKKKQIVGITAKRLGYTVGVCNQLKRQMDIPLSMGY
jgi:hypothetical protein